MTHRAWIYLFIAVFLAAGLPANAGGLDTGKVGSLKLSNAPLPSGVTQDWWSAVQDNVRRSEYDITWQGGAAKGGAYQAPNRAHHLRITFMPNGVRIVPIAGNAAWELELRLSGVGRADALTLPGTPTLHASTNRIEYQYPDGSPGPRSRILEWYLNDDRGLEQGFTLDERPAGGGELVVALAVGSTLRPTLADGAVEFLTGGGVRVLRYGELRAVDAAGRELPAHLDVVDGPSGAQVLLVVDDAGAVYPLTIDPLATTPDWTADSNQIDAWFGISVAGAGDVNGDGYDDVIVGAVCYDNGQTDEGRAYVYHGSAAGLSTTPAWTAESDQIAAGLGFRVAGTGDVNGDGYADVIVGAAGYDNGQTDEGRAFVWLGSPDGVNNGVDGTPLNAAWTAEGDQVSAEFGRSVAGAGDVNGDGYGDVIVGAWHYDGGQGNEGRAYVYHGSPAGLASGPAWTAESNQADAEFGISVEGAGDVNGDGYGDVIVGAWYYDNDQSNEGRAYVYHGSPAGLASGPAWTAESDQADTWFGYSVAGAGDVNGDGYADVIVGAALYDNDQTDEGRVYVYHGSAAGLAASPAWTGESDQDGGNLGLRVAGAGDVNGDGYGDVIVGATGYDGGQTDEGRAYVYQGSAAGVVASPAWTAESDQAYGQFGYSVAGAGDVNGDGYGDVIVGAFKYDGGQTDEGRAYVYHGSPAGLAPGPAWTAQNYQIGARFGVSVAGAGDVNGDGYDEVIVGADSYDNGQTDEGRAFVYYGSEAGLSTTPAWTAESNQTSAQFGYSVAGAGDVNGDGYGDVIVGAYRYDNGQTDEGAVFVWLGSPNGVNNGVDGTPLNAAWTAESNQAFAEFGMAVAGAGDVNGDGYADVIVGAWRRNGWAYVYHGSPAGLAGSAAWMTQGDQPGARFGVSVAGAGDVNGDGYGDVIVGATGYDGGQTDEGRAYVYYGRAAGLAASPAWMAESNQVSARFGISVAGAGDVNGDGYDDVIVGADSYDNGQTDEGRAYVYQGSAAGVAASPAWIAESNQIGARFGVSVAGTGDVNGDGYDEVIVGADSYDNGQTDEGRAFVYHGSEVGLSTTPAWTAEINQTSAQFGYSVAGAGDVNGDGYGDVIVGAYRYHRPADLGLAQVYCGNGGRSLSLRPQQRRADGGAAVGLGGQSISPTEVRLATLGRTPFGRGQVKLQWEVKPLGTPFDGTGLAQSDAWTDSGIAGAALNALAGSLTFETHYHWRARLLYRPTIAPFTSHSRWLRPAASTFFTALSGSQAIGGTGVTSLLGQSSYVDVTTQGSLTSLTLRGYPFTAHPQENSGGVGARMLDRYYTVTPNASPGAFNLQLCLAYRDADVPAGVVEENLRLCRWTGAAWSCLPRGTGSDTGTNLVCAADVTALSDWVLSDTSPMPVTNLYYLPLLPAHIERP